ncbi:hypothetical protein Taro_022023, partial [Colocasia esculenta]|nr:hypothetical protein [Colocasia esculenta]
MADVPSVCEGWELIKASPHLRGSVFSSTAAALLREEVSAVVRFHPCVDDWLVCCDYRCCASTLCGKVAAGDSVTVAATGLPAVDHQIFNKQLPKLLPVWLSCTFSYYCRFLREEEVPLFFTKSSGCRQAAHSCRQASLPELWITGTVCICRQALLGCRQIHTVQQVKALSAAICRQTLLGCRQ